MAQDIVIGGRLHSAATGNTVAGANEILDDAKGKKQNVINQEVDNEIGSDSAAGTIKGRIKNLETAVGSGGSVDERIAETKAEIIGDAAADYNTLGKVEDKIQETKSEILGDAASDYNTLGKIEDKIQAETSRAEAAEGALDNAKANKATTLEGYGIIDAYTKNETYTKTEVNGLVDTPHQNYVTVLTYAALIAIDPGSTDTIYRVSNYDGSVPQVDVTKYSEYAWDGNQYVFLCVKSQIDEVFDISVYNNNAKYADLAAALGTDGANVPQTLRRGGMSVKFVHSVDNKYVQFRLAAQSFTTDVADWISINIDDSEFLDAFQALGLIPITAISWIKNRVIFASNGGDTSVSGDIFYISDFIKVSKGDYYICCAKPSNTFKDIAGYAEANVSSYVSSFNSGRSVDNSDIIKITIPNGINYIRLAKDTEILDFGGIWKIQNKGIVEQLIVKLNNEIQRAQESEQSIEVAFNNVINSIKNELELPVGEQYNIINPNFVIHGYYLRASDGKPTEDIISGSHIASYSDFIPVFIDGVGYNISSINAYSGSAASIASYVVYDENMTIRRIHAAENSYSADRHYTYQAGDYFVRFSFFVTEPLMANYGTETLPYEPYKDRISKLEEKCNNLPIGNVKNGGKSVVCTGDSFYWNDNAHSNFYDDYFEFFEDAGEAQTWVSSILLYPDMGKYIYIKAKITNTGDGVTDYVFLLNPTVSPVGHSWYEIGEGTLQVNESVDVLIPVDLANLVIYHSFNNTLAIWVECSTKADYNTKIKVENFEAYQVNDKEVFTHFEGDNLPELMHSIDEAFDNVEPSGASSEILTDPTGKKYILSVDINGALTTIPLYPKEMYAYGNSLLVSRGFGLAASDQYHDFFALLRQFFLTKEPQFIADRTNILFEQSTSLQDALDKADTLVENTPSTSELLVIQGGDNVSSANYDTIFKPALSHFIEGLRQKCTHARIILVASWYGNLTNLMTEVSNKYGVLFVNIVPCRGSLSNSYIGAILINTSTWTRSLENVTSCTEQTNDSEYYEYKLAITFTVNGTSYNTILYCHTYSLSGTTLSYNSEQEVIDTAAEASHPGDEGFRLIANKILYDGGYVDTPEYYTSN